MTRNTLINVTNDIKSYNRKVVLTTGAFDVLHCGHLTFLSKSRGYDKVIVVGIESDERISYYKGNSRPIIPLQQRLEMLSQIQFVDFIFPILGKEYTPEYYLKLYDELRPNIITYGRGYSEEKYIRKAASYFETIKFKKVIARYASVQSTTKIIDRVISLNK